MAVIDPFKTVDTGNVFDDIPVVDPNKDYWSEFVGEGKKYQDQSAAGRALAEKEAHILRLQNETKGMREELNQRKTAAEIFDQFKSLQTPPIPGNQPGEGDDTKDKNSLTAEQLEQLLDQKLQERVNRDKSQDNYNRVVTELANRFGDNAQRVVAQKAAELGVEGKFLSDMAKTNPAVFMSLFDKVTQTEGDLFSGVAPRNQITTNGTTKSDVVNGARTKSHYDKIKADDPNRYWSVAVQGQMHRDAAKLREKFYT